MSLKQFFFVVATFVVIATACKKQPSSFNLEQKNHPTAQKIMAPGMSSIGLINDGQLFVYYLSESQEWVLDKVSQFDIPSKNDGLLALGMGTIAVLNNDKLYFYYMNSSHEWDNSYELTMPVPSDYKKISAMKMPWQHGAIALEDHNKTIRFYYLDDNKRWQNDETANFTLPENIENYIMMGAMEIAIISDNKLGIYQLDYAGNWQFIDNMVLALPEDTEAVLSFEPGIIATLSDNTLHFFEADMDNGLWILDETMNFPLPL